jgi:hypothetical protein
MSRTYRLTKDNYLSNTALTEWEHDDHGLERVYNDRQSAQEMFNTIISWSHVTMDDLRKHGFKGS